MEGWYENLIAWFERVEGLFVVSPFSKTPPGVVLRAK